MNSKNIVKKVFLIFFIIIAIGIVAVPIVISLVIMPSIRKEFYGGWPADPEQRKAYIFETSEPWVQGNQNMKYYGYSLPTDSQLQELKNKTDLTRHYPPTIKALFGPGAITNTTDLLYFGNEITDLGVNTYWVIGEYRLENNKAVQFLPGFNQMGFPGVLSQEDAKKMLAYRILLAKQLGLATILIPDFPSATNIGRSNYDTQKINPELERVALELARVAETYGAEYLAPMNEYEHMLFSNGYSVDEIVSLENAFYADLIPKIRAIYHGKIVYKCGNVGDWPNFVKLSMKGADLFGVGNAYTGGVDETTKDMTAKAKAADIVSARDSVPWIESEFLIFRPIDQENWMGKVYSTYPIEKSYQEGITAFRNTAKRAVGFTFMSWTAVGRIRGTTSAEVLKNFFATWKPTETLPAKIIPSEFIFSQQNTSILDWFKNLPDYYSLAFNMLTGKMGPQKDPRMGMGGPGGCKGKAECEAFCAKPENQKECENFSLEDQQHNPGQNSQGPKDLNNQQPNQGGPGGCRSDTECRTYCDKPENKTECSRFQPQNLN